MDLLENGKLHASDIVDVDRHQNGSLCNVITNFTTRT